jgi:hypothetical protein
MRKIELLDFAGSIEIDNNMGINKMNDKSDEMGLGEKAAKIRTLGMTLEFAPVDFSAWLSAVRNDEQIERFIASFESKSDDGTLNYQNNKAQISMYRNKKLTKE